MSRCRCLLSSASICEQQQANLLVCNRTKYRTVMALKIIESLSFEEFIHEVIVTRGQLHALAWGLTGKWYFDMIPMLLLTPRTLPYTVSLAGTVLPHHLLPNTQNAPSYTCIYNFQANYFSLRSCQPVQEAFHDPLKFCSFVLSTTNVPCTSSHDCNFLFTFHFTH